MRIAKMVTAFLSFSRRSLISWTKSVHLPNAEAKDLFTKKTKARRNRFCPSLASRTRLYHVSNDARSSRFLIRRTTFFAVSFRRMLVSA